MELNSLADIKAYMSESRSVEDWNARRVRVQDSFNRKFLDEQTQEAEKQYNDAMSLIDCSGLIVEVLGKDPVGVIHHLEHPELYFTSSFSHLIKPVTNEQGQESVL